MAVLGGVGSLMGALLGAVYFVGMPLIPGLKDIEFIELLTSGLGLLLILNFLPGGLAEGVFQIRDNILRRIAARRGILVPSLVADSLVVETAATEHVVEEAAVEHELVEVPTLVCPECGETVVLEEALLPPHFSNGQRRRAGDVMNRRLATITGGASAVPLAVLFGLNFVDEFDRAAFAALIPEIRDAFNLSDTGIQTLGAITGVFTLIAALPMGVLADRFNRVRLSIAAAVLWGVTSVLTGVVPGSFLLYIVPWARAWAASLTRWSTRVCSGPYRATRIPRLRRASVGKSLGKWPSRWPPHRRHDFWERRSGSLAIPTVRSWPSASPGS